MLSDACLAPMRNFVTNTSSSVPTMIMSGGGLIAGLSRAGEGEIHNGADDNASGVAALLELAEAYALNRLRPKRTLIFVAFDAEEMGLHGSNAFVAEGGYPIESMQRDGQPGHDCQK